MEKAKWNQDRPADAMKICHVSFGEIKADTPAQWLSTVPYFTSILAKMSKSCQVFSFHYASREEAISFENVSYRFLRNSFGEIVQPGDLVSSVRRLNPDAIIIHGFHSCFRFYRFVSRMRGFRIFVQHHGEKVFGFPKAAMQTIADQHVTGYFFSSKEMGEEWVRAGLIRNAKKNRILELLEVTSSFPVSQNEQVRNDRLNFIWVGRLDANKDPMTLIKGFVAFLKVHPQANLYLIFNTIDLLTDVKAGILGFKNNIHLVGEVAHGEMPKWYAKCDFIISTSLFEAAGVSVLEGMACGCIPILSDIPSFRKILAGGEIGLLFSRRSSEALSDALVKASLLEILRERKKMLYFFESHLSATALANQIIEFTIGDIQKEKSFASR